MKTDLTDSCMTKIFIVLNALFIVLYTNEINKTVSEARTHVSSISLRMQRKDLEVLRQLQTGMIDATLTEAEEIELAYILRTDSWS